ncbi:MAG TPA: TetR/AcrR family transcriptional regulator [Solirubrobacteraceae bacterium]|nr:TetR/AcrR family transcriptional regulator [Solirubrobacteraceae bacterium]
MASPSRLSRAESQARTRQALLDAAGEVFVERGLHRTSVEAIAERAGFTRGAFYSNFGSKEELFAELLQSTVYRAYREMGERQLSGGEPIPTARETARTLARIQAHPDGRWMFRLWLELLLEAGRDEKMRKLALEFWRTNRKLIAKIVEKRFAERGEKPPLEPMTMSSALIAMDIGLAIQHHVDPEAVPLAAYPDVFGALFDPL